MPTNSIKCFYSLLGFIPKMKVPWINCPLANLELQRSSRYILITLLLRYSLGFRRYNDFFRFLLYLRYLILVTREELI